jgi:hypothetical protein
MSMLAFSPFEKTAIQTGKSGQWLGNLLPAQEHGKRSPRPFRDMTFSTAAQAMSGTE